METTADSSARMAVKLSYAGETHRVTLAENDRTFDALCALVPETFGLAPPRTWTLVYTDNEGDLVTVSSALEFAEARRVFLELNGGRKAMHLRVLARVSVKDQIPPAVLQAVDELSSTIARLASDTRESLSQSTYLERGRASVAHSAKQTKEFLESARKEIAQRLKDVQARIVGEIERRRSSASSAGEAGAAVPVEAAELEVAVAAAAEEAEASLEPATEASVEGIKIESRHSLHILEEDSDDEDDADVQAGDSDDEDEDEAKSQEVAAAVEEAARAAGAAAVQPAAVALREEEEEEETEEAVDVVYESDAETVASSSSDEDDDDDDDDGSDQDWDVVPDVWNAEVSLIRTILPHVHVEDCVAMLRKHNGNLEAAINELTDV